MDKYFNQNTGEWYHEGQSITKWTKKGIFSGIPSIEQLRSWGFTKYVEPELTEQQLLEKAKKDKISEIEEYNKSNNVNSFTINGTIMWLTVEERQQIATQITACKAVNRTEMTRWYNGIEFTFPIALWEQMLIALEVYAGDALNVTESHKAAVNTLTTIEEIEAYDITTGYPPKMSFPQS